MGPIGAPHAPGATPTDPDEVAELIPTHITTLGQLDEWEASNILESQKWAFSTRNRKQILSEGYVRGLHKRMFDKTWKWAGTFRKTEKSIGIDPAGIAVALHNLLADVETQLEFNTYPIDEIATRLHHRLVLIHPFPNGNGRHARMFTDAFLKAKGSEAFTWGRVNLTQASETRAAYIAALQEADRRNYQPLLNFVRS